MAFGEGLKALREKSEEARQADKGRDRGANYGNRTPGSVFGTRHKGYGPENGYGATNRFQDSRGYSYVRAMAAAVGAVGPEDAKEECETDAFLKKHLTQQGFQTRFGRKGMLAIGSSRLLPETIGNTGETWHEMKQFKEEIRQKIWAATPKYMDYDHPAVQSWLGTKSLDVQTRVKTMNTTNDTAGGTFVPSPAQGELIDLQRNFEAFTRAGSREISLPPQGRVTLPKQTGGSTAYWVGDPNSGITTSDLSTGNLFLEAKLLGVLTNVSDQLMRFSDPQIENLIRYDQAMQAGLAADSAMFTGTGGTQIKGLLTYPTSSTWTQGTDKVLLLTASTVASNGDTFQPQDAVKMKQILPDPVQQMPTTFVMYTPFSEYIMAKRADAVSANDQAGPFVYQINRDPVTGLPLGLYGAKLVTSYNVPANRIKGSGTNLTICLVGAFQDWIIARSGVVEFDSNPYTNFANVQTQLRTIQYIDAGPRHLASFCYIDSLLQTP